MSESTPPFAGMAALITGGGSGIGLASARHLLRDGAAVTICGRSEERLSHAVDDLRSDAPGGSVVQSIPCDVADESAVIEAVKHAREPLGGLHLVVASAGTGTVGPVLATSVDEWDRVLTSNLRGTFLTIKHAGAELVRSGGGSIVAISSLAGNTTHRFMAPYCASKAGIDMLVNVAADELGPSNVRVNSVQPSLVDTELAAMLIGDDAIRNDYLSQMPVSRIGTADDVASLVRFLCGPESTWITGCNIPLDGGHHIRRGPNYDTLARAIYGEACDNIVPPPQ